MSEQPYHKYVFDSGNRIFVGNFDEMYKNEDIHNYDSWFQEDVTHLGKQLSLVILNNYNFDTILDIGCGKGAFTHLLKKMNNNVMGIDVSETAVKKARAKYKNIEFTVCTAENIAKLGRKWDLVVLYEVLSYIDNWKEVLRITANISDYIFISLFIPEEPIGYVKNFHDLKAEISLYFETINCIMWNEKTILFFGKKKHD